MANETKEECIKALTKLRSIFEWIENWESIEIEAEDGTKKNETKSVEQDI